MIERTRIWEYGKYSYGNTRASLPRLRFLDEFPARRGAAFQTSLVERCHAPYDRNTTATFEQRTVELSLVAVGAAFDTNARTTGALDSFPFASFIEQAGHQIFVLFSYSSHGNAAVSRWGATE